MVDALKDIDINIQEAIALPGLTVIPIYSPRKSEARIQKLFGDALTDSSLKIKELQSSTVPVLNVEYSGEGYALGIKGNLLVGGGQDRQLIHSCVVSKGSYEIPVQCVQHGRWNPNQNKEFTSSPSLTSSSLRFNTQNQQQTWAKIRSYETITNTRSGTESFTATQTLTMASDMEVRSKNLQVNDKMERVRKRSKEMKEKLSTVKENQIGFLAIQVEPFEWLEHQKTKTKYLMELVGSSQIWQKIHQKAMESLVYDTAICEMDQIFTIDVDHERKSEIAEFMAMLTIEDWNESSEYIGQENRFELKSEKFFGEAIYLGDDSLPVHMIASSL